MNKSWLDLKFFENDVYRVLDFIEKEKKKGKTILPKESRIFAALDYVEPEDVKVVILGQDPYPNRKYPNGLAFSVNKEIKQLPKSLVNIFKELNNDLQIKRTNGDLSDWAKQGVLLLNTILTVEEGKPLSHKNIGWEKLTREIIVFLSKNFKNIVFILWGNQAQQKEYLIENYQDHYVIKSPHPSPLSANRGFFNSSPFSKTNIYLTDHGKQPIIWG